ncbi:MAG TPA: orotidine-5'-phosphate decarboxylase, partial [Acidobacteriota bacterium]|nr:orotidine-5'-phosphate decarboxylase [Acidobacteriota bacterium]
KIFLDLKFHDIPNTVRGAVRSACRLGVHLLTVHASGGGEMLAAACREALSSSRPPLLLAVTALTSLSEADARRLGVTVSVEGWVEKLAELAYDAGIRGLVASGNELPMLRRKFPREMRLVIPGIRPAATAFDDQARAVTPGDAMRAGADYLVVGRPVLRAEDPAAAADAIVGEMAKAIVSDRIGQA